MDAFARCVVFTAMVAMTTGHPYFRQRIPNGDNIPHPCKADHIWKGVGHENEGGGGARNPFGMDFFSQGKQWTVELCNMDSDNDGLTNGQELGDPDCVWTEGATPNIIDRALLSHPGVCNDFADGSCTKPEWVSCENVECSGLSEANVMAYNFTFPPTPVPSKDTTYICTNFELPSDGDYHMIATLPLIDNINVLHHMVVYGCDGPETADDLEHDLNTPYECLMGDEPKCTDIIDAWAIGGTGTCLNSNIGFRVGTKGLKFMYIEIHWDNAQMLDTYVDGSGVQLFLTPNIRQYDAATLTIGQNQLDIPPNVFWHEESAECSKCMTQIVREEIFVASVFNHMHYLGRRHMTELFAYDGTVTVLGYDPDYSFESPVTHQLNPPVQVRNTDKLKTTCIYQSRDRTKTTKFGLGSYDEMCYAFLTVYPKENLLKKECSNWRSVEMCSFEDLTHGIIQDCSLDALFNTANPDNIALGKLIMDNCDHTGITCYDECKNAVKLAKKIYPCARGDVYDVGMTYALQVPSADYRAGALSFHAAFRSCDVAMAQDACPEVSSSTTLFPALFVNIFSALTLLSF